MSSVCWFVGGVVPIFRIGSVTIEPLWLDTVGLTRRGGH